MESPLIVSTNFTLDDTMRRRALQKATPTGLRGWLTGLTQPHILFPALTVLVLGLIWGGTLNLIKVERAHAASASAAATLELLNTYNAQVVRALREIDQTLKLVQYEYKSTGTNTRQPLR